MAQGLGLGLAGGGELKSAGSDGVVRSLGPGWLDFRVGRGFMEE
jgi:hypothetical protein